ncbi:MAG: DUF4426 domain-containing protein [Halioglobus sp.]
MIRKYLICLAYTILTMASAQAQQFEKFGPYELHYAVVNTTFLDPSVAGSYGITRGEKRAIINLSVLDTSADGNPARTMLLKGRTWDLIQNQFLSFEEIREGDAIYYIAEFKFINEEWRFFEIDFRPDNAGETFTFKFKHQLYIN